MKKIVFALMSVAAFIACSNDEVIPSHNSAIEFNPTTKNSVRTITTTTNNISKFNVWSYTAEGKTVMNNIEVSKATGEWAYSPVKYWPYDATLDFYGITPTTLVGTGNGSVEHHIDVEVSADAAKINFAGASISDTRGEFFYCQNYPDILYATALNLTKENNNGTKVTMNFRHAMAQVEFKVKNSSTIDSEVSYQPSIVMIDGIDNAGTYTLPMASTTLDFAAGESHGSWTTSLSKEGVPHSFNVIPNYIAPGSDAVLITDANDIHYVLPQKKDDAELIVTFGVQQGEHFIEGVLKNVALPVDWKEGHKYTYTLVVNSAIDPDLNDLIIDFDVTVDEMVIVPAQEIVFPN